MAEFPVWGTVNSGSIEALVFALAPPLSSIRSDLYRHMIKLLVQAREDAGFAHAELGKRIGQRQTFVSNSSSGNGDSTWRNSLRSRGRSGRIRA
jgi:hypothetical protein